VTHFLENPNSIKIIIRRKGGSSPFGLKKKKEKKAANLPNTSHEAH
jgi:hypothetical protein